MNNLSVYISEKLKINKDVINKDINNQSQKVSKMIDEYDRKYEYKYIGTTLNDFVKWYSGDILPFDEFIDSTDFVQTFYNRNRFYDFSELSKKEQEEIENFFKDNSDEKIIIYQKHGIVDIDGVVIIPKLEKSVKFESSDFYDDYDNIHVDFKEIKLK